MCCVAQRNASSSAHWHPLLCTHDGTRTKAERGELQLYSHSLGRVIALLHFAPLALAPGLPLACEKRETLACEKRETREKAEQRADRAWWCAVRSGFLSSVLQWPTTIAMPLHSRPLHHYDVHIPLRHCRLALSLQPCLRPSQPSHNRELALAARGPHVDYTWTTRGPHVDYTWTTRGLHVDSAFLL